MKSLYFLGLVKIILIALFFSNNANARCYNVKTNSGAGWVNQSVCDDDNDDDGYEDEDEDSDFDEEDDLEERDDNIINKSDYELALDAALATKSLSDSLKQAMATEGLTPEGKAQIQLQVDKLVKLQTKLNLAASLASSGVQISTHTVKGEIGYALSEAAAMLAAMGITVTVTNPVTATIAAITAAFTVEFTGDYIVDSIGEYTDTIMKEADDHGGWDYITCRNFVSEDYCDEGLIPPIIVDMTGNGLKLKSLEESKAAFDIDNDGKREKLSWFGFGNGILVYDINNSGLADDISEFSIAHLTGKSARSDLDGLQMLDSNNDGFISEKDNEYSYLLLWLDNGDGVSEPKEMFKFSEMEISISLNRKELYKSVKGNVVANTVDFIINGEKRIAYDVFLKTNYQEND